mmetsp:Transcript_28626/g.51858  ORF Transcript_28626/g.51858 Transcript_28626/m.51858 type:complete len:90 (-) Transcript_28626:401-670(-)
MACLASVWGILLTYNFHRRDRYQWPTWQGNEDYRWRVIQKGGFRSILENPLVWEIFKFLPKWDVAMDHYAEFRSLHCRNHTSLPSSIQR